MPRLTHNLAAFTLLTLASPILAECPNPSDPANRPNIVLFIADDLGWADLPYFNPPVEWRSSLPQDTFDYRIWRPDLNRFAARTMAAADGTSNVRTIDAPNLPAPPISYATPIPNSGCGHAVANPAGCDAKSDVLEGHGGLAKIAAGAKFSRFYSAASVCSPSRASIFSGLHVPKHKAKLIGSHLKPTEVTVAEYLKQGCTDPAAPQCRSQANGLEPCPCYTNFSQNSCSTAPCYSTGFVGKWHIGGDGDTSPWEQGFDEYVGFLGGSRDYFANESLVCSPGRGRCQSDLDRECLVDADCGAGTCLPRELYVGPDPSGSCPGPDCCSDRRYPIVGPNGKIDKQQSRTVACNDNSGEALDASCSFSERIYRDLAVNYIKRHAADVYNGQPRPFFLAVAWHGTHSKWNAPERPRLHYQTSTPGGASVIPSRPSHAVDFWSILEELDAAVGQIYATLETTGRCSAQSDTVCSTANPPGGCGTCMPLADKTVVLFTNDNGRPSDQYGNPRLRGNKGATWEGSVRTGLLARACTEPAGELDLSDHIAGHVDIFPTIAEAAGFEVKSDAPIDGHSFYALINQGSASQPPPATDFAFAEQGEAIVMSRPGYYVEHPVLNNGGVCGHDELREPQPYRPHDVLRAGSCKTCNAPSQCADVECRIPGHVCVTGGKVCSNTQSTCTKHDECGSGKCVYPANAIRERCEPASTVCSAGTCKRAVIECTECIPAAWKLARGANAVQHLFDLATNPEEDNALECRIKPGVVDPERAAIQADLGARLTAEGF